ncbi:hypothetical protein FTUN_0922 [Frigoriglobus tundricola]|uniref:Uncharacterized protein n=1 Tax=Frigoriglobus tundricola TaxID=2774151 RepID=A0A6M5YJH0_9BACT|nr:hypothetical protein FTUN_0922 [Frigoriglobus tundricola]
MIRRETWAGAALLAEWADEGVYRTATADTVTTTAASGAPRNRFVRRGPDALTSR